MNMIFKVFSKKFFGAKKERLFRTVCTDLIVFWGLSMADFKTEISPSVLYLTVSAFTAGVMRQTLFSEDNAVYMENLIMLPFDRRKFVFSYTAAMGLYTLLTKTAALLSVLLAVSSWNQREIWGSILCSVNAVLTTAAMFSLKKHPFISIGWTAAAAAALLFLWSSPWFTALLTFNIFFSIFLLEKADGYAFFRGKTPRIHKIKKHRRHSIWIYFFRYLTTHKNYLINTAIMWCVAWMLPVLMARQRELFMIPIGFAILTLNTPAGILLSCDPSLEQAVRVLPGQKKTFCIPYCLFIFLCNITADVIFLARWKLLTGDVPLWMSITALFFSLQSAVFSLLLEWFFPLRNWKTESDLWHHPRKYIVPAVMLLLAGTASFYFFHIQ